MNIKDVYWLAGLLEGEGSFMHCKGHSPNIQLSMTDEDVVVKARSLLSTKCNIRAYSPKGNRRTIFILKVYGNDAIQWMMVIYSLMGRRRKEKIREIIHSWKNMVGKGDYANNLTKYRIIKDLAKMRNISVKEARIIFETTLRLDNVDSK